MFLQRNYFDFVVEVGLDNGWSCFIFTDRVKTACTARASELKDKKVKLNNDEQFINGAKLGKG